MDAGDPLLSAVRGARVGGSAGCCEPVSQDGVLLSVAMRRAPQGVWRVVGGCPSSSVGVLHVRCGCGLGFFDGPAPVRLAAAGRGAFFQRARGWVSIPTCEAGFVVGPPNGL